MQGISNHTYQDLIQDLSFIIRKTEDKCKFHVIRVGASTNRNMIGGGANEVQNFTASAYSVWSDRTFYCTGYSTILINATRTLLTKACKSGFYLIVAFWLRFLFVAELIWAVAAIFHSEANTAGSE